MKKYRCYGCKKEIEIMNDLNPIVKCSKCSMEMILVSSDNKDKQRKKEK